MPNRKWEDKFATALKREWENRRDEIKEPFETIYLGGGTPSILSDNNLESIVEILPHENIKEFTIEVNPEDVSKEKVAFWRGLGVNRISMGVQSFNDLELETIGRRHKSLQACEAIEIIKDGGISNFSLDLIFGLPGQSLESWEQSLGRLLDYQPTHFSSYLLSYEPRTKLTAMLKSGQLTEADDNLIEKMYRLLCQSAQERGYEHYEISNFCQKGKQAIHNSNYWADKPYLGLGPSAHSFDGKIRRANHSNLKLYLECIENGKETYLEETETATDRYNERIMLGLRTKEGIALDRLSAEEVSRLRRDSKKWIANGGLIEQDKFIYIPEEKWLISDAIISDLFVVV